MNTGLLLLEGRPAGWQQAGREAYRRALAAACGPGDVRAVFVALLEAALDGDVEAARLVLEYTIGPPRGVSEPRP